MMLYQVVNFQFQVVDTFKDQESAVAHVKKLREIYREEGFYVVELKVIYQEGI